MHSWVNSNLNWLLLLTLGNHLPDIQEFLKRAVDEGVLNKRITEGVFFFIQGFTHQNFQHIQDNVQDSLDHLREFSKEDSSQFYRRHEAINF